MRVATYRCGLCARKELIMSNTISFAASTKTAAYFTFDHIRKTIVGSEFNFKMSGNPTKPQYEALMTAKKMQPTYSLELIVSKMKVEKKQSYEGLTMHLMEEYLNLVYEGELAEEACKQFAAMKAKKDQRELSYPTIKSWFLDLFPKFNVNKAKKQISEKKLENKKAPHRVVKVTVAMPHTSDK
jgi:hypothetical protein